LVSKVGAGLNPLQQQNLSTRSPLFEQFLTSPNLLEPSQPGIRKKNYTPMCFGSRSTLGTLKGTWDVLGRDFGVKKKVLFSALGRT